MDIWDVVGEYPTFNEGYKVYLELLEKGKVRESVLSRMESQGLRDTPMEHSHTGPPYDVLLYLYYDVLKSKIRSDYFIEITTELFDFLDTFSPEDRTMAILKYFKGVGYYFVPNYYLNGLSLGLLTKDDMRAFIRATVVKTKNDDVVRSENFICCLVTIAGLIESGIIDTEDIFDMVSIEEEGLSSLSLYLSNSDQLRTILDTVYGTAAIPYTFKYSADDSSFIAHILLFVAELRTSKAIEIMRSRVLPTISCESLFDDFSAHVYKLYMYRHISYVIPSAIIRVEEVIEKSCGRLITDLDTNLLSNEGRLRRIMILYYGLIDDV